MNVGNEPQGHEPPHEGQAEHQADRVTDAETLTRREQELKDEFNRVLHEKEQAHRRIARWQFGAYALVMVLSILGWWQIQNEGDERCEAGRVNRQALVDLVLGVDQLGRNLVIGSSDPNSPTPAQQRALDDFDAFKNEQLKNLDDPICGGKIDFTGTTHLNGD